MSHSRRFPAQVAAAAALEMYAASMAWLVLLVSLWLHLEHKLLRLPHQVGLDAKQLGQRKLNLQRLNGVLTA